LHLILKINLFLYLYFFNQTRFYFYYLTKGYLQTFFFFTNVAHSQGERANGRKGMKGEEKQKNWQPTVNSPMKHIN
jgi:hypothetical protein